MKSDLLKSRICAILRQSYRTTREVVVEYNSNLEKGHGVNYDQVNKALNSMVKDGNVGKVNAGNAVIFFAIEDGHGNKY